MKIAHDAGATILHVSPGGITLVPRLADRLWIARKVVQVLRGAPSLR